MEKEGSSFRKLIRDALYEGLKTMLGKIIAVIILVILLSRVPMIRDLFTSYKDLTDSRSEDVKPKAPKVQKPEETRPTENIQRQPETQRQVQTKSETKRPAMSDVYFVELCKSGNVREVEEAIRNDGANVNAKANNGWTALMWTALKGHTEIAELLIKYGADINAADINAKDKDGYTALMWAAYQGQTEAAEFLIKYGADVNAKTNSGWTALMSAAHGNTKTAELLIKYGADVNAETNNGYTALMSAAVHRNTKTAELLIKYGADVNAKDNNGWTVLRYATNSHPETAELLRKYGAK